MSKGLFELYNLVLFIYNTNVFKDAHAFNGHRGSKPCTH